MNKYVLTLADLPKEIVDAAAQRLHVKLRREAVADNLSRLLTLDSDNAAVYQSALDSLNSVK